MFGPPGSITNMARAMGIHAERVDGRDVAAVYEVAGDLIEYVRTGRPAFLECEVYRVRAHSISDADYRYRPKAAGTDWLDANDPIAAARKTLEEQAPGAADRIDAEIDEIVAAAVKSAEAGESPTPQSAFDMLYATEGLEWNGRVEVC